MKLEQLEKELESAETMFFLESKWWHETGDRIYCECANMSREKANKIYREIKERKQVK